MKNNSCGQTLKWYVYSDVFIQSCFVIVYKLFYPLFLCNILYIFFQTYLSTLKNEDALDTHDNHLLMWSPWTRIEKWQKSFLLIYLNTVFLLKQLFMYERKARLMNCNYGPSLISNPPFLKIPGNKPVIVLTRAIFELRLLDFVSQVGNSHIALTKRITYTYCLLA